MLRRWALCVAPGEGVVSRTASTVLLVPPGAPADQVAKLQAVIAAHETRAVAAPSSRPLLRDIATIFAEVEDLASFALVTDHGDGLALLLHGDVGSSIVGVDGTTETVSGRESQTWVDRLLPTAPASMTVGVAPPAPGGVSYDLRDGTVPGSGVMLHGAGAPAVAPPPPAPVVVAAPPVPDPPAAAVSPPTEPVAAAPAPVGDDETVLVRGVMCVNGHFNRPTVSYCSVCGTSMQHLTLRPVEGPRPPLGVLVLPDGAVVTVDRDLVIGREPATHPDVVAGRARAVSVDDPALTVSRAHALIRLHDWDVRVQDNASSNGTRLLAPGSGAETAVRGDDCLPLTAGAVLVLGTYRLTFSSSLH